MPATLQTVPVSLRRQRRYACESLLEQGSGASNEDALLVRDGLYGVFDGASSLKGQLYRGRSGAWWAAHLARAVFFAADDSLVALAERANATIAKGMILSDVDRSDRLQLWSTSAAVVRVNEASIEFVQSGDALILCIREDGSFHLPVPYRNHDRPTLEQWKMLVDLGFENVPELLSPQIEQVRLQMNRSYGVLNGEVEMSDFLQTGTIANEGLAHLLVFTDGLHLPSPAAGGVDFAGMVDCYRERGLSGLHRAVRGIERSDPDCRNFPRFKTHDDLSAIALDFTV